MATLATIDFSRYAHAQLDHEPPCEMVLALEYYDPSTRPLAEDGRRTVREAAMRSRMLSNHGANAALEPHRSVREIAELWRYSETKVREMFREEIDVLQSQLRSSRSRKRQNVTLMIPESVIIRVHERMSVRPS